MASSMTARRILSQISKSNQFVRRINTSSVKQAAGNELHAANDPNAYLHAEHMYDLPAMKNRKLKIGLAIGGIVGGGVGLSVFAILFSQSKTKSG